jgi:hypothetical protein
MNGRKAEVLAAFSTGKTSLSKTNGLMAHLFSQKQQPRFRPFKLSAFMGVRPSLRG